MANSRKDLRGNALFRGEHQRKSDKRYMYIYTDPIGRKKYIYADNLLELRRKEDKLKKDQLDGLDIYAAGLATINSTYDRYISTRIDLKDSTQSNYEYTYERYIRDDFGKKKLVDVKYSDVLQFYTFLHSERHLSFSTIESVDGLLHPTFELAVRDDIIRKNPTDGAKRELAKRLPKTETERQALTPEQQKAFMEYVAMSPVYYHWWPLFTVLLGTGMRIGECTGLRWQDIDLKEGWIDVNHTLSYYPQKGSRTSKLRISTPKTKAGCRVIPMMDAVRDAFQFEKENQLAGKGYNQTVVDGYSGFIFQNKYGSVMSAASVNKAIKRIYNDYNHEEELDAVREDRDPIILPHFTCHYLRRTFATRLCEVEDNPKVIQAVMGHRQISTTYEIYADSSDRRNKESINKLAAKLNGVF
ncbi:tyrosine-type recombinase/integrase [Butyrivibrio sp. AD3002]|uniref:tyrosine-type recombinase/integrase n=1 Tax=Butyrivibrio sp. AD3002 TaxID=1280670 RepID=UPI0003B47858|nr:tyrosine-type recombinase/integrase [Butyrivibrio sp. AD3002]